MTRTSSRVASLEAQHREREQARLDRMTDEELDAEYAKIPAYIRHYLESLADIPIIGDAELDRRARAYRP